jgi:hypothetical protein
LTAKPSPSAPLSAPACPADPTIGLSGARSNGTVASPASALSLARSRDEIALHQTDHGGSRPMSPGRRPNLLPAIKGVSKRGQARATEVTVPGASPHRGGAR